MVVDKRHSYSEEEITNERLRHVLDMHRADITTMLSDMCAQQLLESYRYGRGTKYHVYGIEVATSDGKVATSDGKVATSDGKVATSDGKVATYKAKYTREELTQLIIGCLRICANSIDTNE